MYHAAEDEWLIVSASLEKILGIQIEDAQQRTVDPYEGMTKEQLINELRTARVS